MNCYRYENGDSGRVIACKDHGPVMLLQPPPVATVPFPMLRYSSRERRRVARCNSGPGRRRARTVRTHHVHVPKFVELPAPIRLHGHMLGQSNGYRVMLYLRADVTLTQAHIDDVERADHEQRLERDCSAVWGST